MIEFSTKVLRKQDNLPRYVVVRGDLMAGYTKSVSAIVNLNNGPDLSRTIRPWGKGADAWFFNLTAEQAKRSSVDTGDSVRVCLRIK